MAPPVTARPVEGSTETTSSPFPPPPEFPLEGATADAGASAAPVETPEGSPLFQLEGHISAGAAALDHNNDYFFGLADTFGRVGDFVHVRAGLSGRVRLLGDPTGPQFRLGATVDFDHYMGDQNVDGGNISGLSLGPVAELDLRAMWGNSPIAVFPRLWADFRVGYGWGTIPAETISLHHQEGAFLAASLGVDVLSLRFLGLDTSLGAMFETSMVDGRVFNSPMHSISAYLSFRGPAAEEIVVEGPPPPPEVHCESDYEQVQALIAEINGNGGDVEGLRAESSRLEGEVADLRHHIETRTTDPLDVAAIRDILRQQMVERLVADGTAEAAATAAALAEYPDSYNHWETVAPLPDGTDVPADIDADDCEALAALRERLQEERDGLQRRVGDLDRLRRSAFRPRVREVVTRTIQTVMPELQQLHFENNRPNQAQLDRLITRLNAAHGDLTAAPVTRSLTEIFGSGSRVVEIIRNAASRLNGDEIDDLAVREAMRSIRVTVEGHTSLAGRPAANQSLSERRATAVLELLVAAGVDRARLSAAGFGETRPERADEESFPSGSPARAEAAAINRRIVLVPDEASVRAAEETLAHSTEASARVETEVMSGDAPPPSTGGTGSRRRRSEHSEETPPPPPTAPRIDDEE